MSPETFLLLATLGCLAFAFCVGAAAGVFFAKLRERQRGGCQPITTTKPQEVQQPPAVPADRGAHPDAEPVADTGNPEADRIIDREPETDRNAALLAANTDLLTYVLQGDVHNRLTPRVIDIAYTAFMQAKAPNDEDGGPSDWFNDTKPMIERTIEKLRRDLFAERDARKVEQHAASTVPATRREFTNELGNSIRIVIEGPTSVSENILTPEEVTQLRGALNEHGIGSSKEGGDGA